MLSANELFDETFYLAKNPDVAAGVASGRFSSAADHFFTFGEVEGRDPSAFFDTSYYLAQNQDIVSAVASFDLTPFEHFINAGQGEGRIPTPFFDINFYRQENPDVAAAVDRDELTGSFVHYVQSGSREGRDPNALFDTRYYLQQNPDVTAAVQQGLVTAIEHFITSGQFEGRQPNSLFDANFYLTTYPDVAARVAQGITTAIEHFITSGQFEGRNPNRFFDTGYYLNRYPDVAAAVGANQFSAIAHFIESGQFEGRLPRPLFSQMYVFGDSLSDDGNLFAATGGVIPPSPPYFNGRLSNGPVWVENLAPLLGLAVNPDTNVAFSGATTGTLNTLNQQFPELPPLPGLQVQIDGFIAATPSADPNGLYVLLAGPNDYLNAGITDVTVPVSNTVNAVTKLAQDGARNFLVANLPDLGATPGVRNRGPQAQQFLTQLTNLHNSSLAAAMDNIDLNPNINITLFDLNALVNDTIVNPSNYGFTNVTDAFLESGATNPNEFVFYDGIHPTARSHAIVANTAAKTITAIPELVNILV